MPPPKPAQPNSGDTREREEQEREERRTGGRPANMDQLSISPEARDAARQLDDQGEKEALTDKET